MGIYTRPAFIRADALVIPVIVADPEALVADLHGSTWTRADQQHSRRRGARGRSSPGEASLMMSGVGVSTCISGAAHAGHRHDVRNPSNECAARMVAESVVL